MKGVFTSMGKTVVCKLDQNGYLNSTIYILSGGYTVNQIATTVIDVADTISTICENDKIETVALYGPATHLGKIRQNILSNKTKFAYNDTEVLINPIEGVV